MTKILSTITLILVSSLIYAVYVSNNHSQDSQFHPKAVIYTKSYCQFCSMAKKLLTQQDITYHETDITKDQKLHLELIAKTQQKTVPYIFINQKFIGGYQQLTDLIESNSLSNLLFDAD